MPEKVSVLRPDPDTEGERERDGRPIIGVVRDASASLGLMLSVHRFLYLRHVPGYDAVQSLEYHMFIERLIGVPLDIYEYPLGKFVLHLVPRPRRNEEIKAGIADQFNAPLAKQFADEDIGIYNQAEATRGGG